VKYEHILKGFNSRLDTLQAAVLRVKLRRLEQWNGARRKAAAKYDRFLAGTSLVTPKLAPYAKHVYHLYVVQVPDRKKQQAAFDAASVSHVIHYPVPVHLQPAFADLGYNQGSFPVTEALVPKIISLPMFPEIIDSQIERVAKACLTS
jgi:dTDP-4-amino-4,6-dideoxygalactose transaminase